MCYSVPGCRHSSQPRALEPSALRAPATLPLRASPAPPLCVDLLPPYLAPSYLLVTPEPFKCTARPESPGRLLGKLQPSTESLGPEDAAPFADGTDPKSLTGAAKLVVCRSCDRPHLGARPLTHPSRVLAEAAPPWALAPPGESAADSRTRPP